ncbi:uncharacterized protein K444DRAFT_608094 [Hyaloscypha bicolor E]|uniref:Uncharacterized protein n=1 Tax=Hyaloscypha bicolor E TaxID=1095630 RepID=A0A2J6TR81_9HELO|nr:uncharacterized protein K444DRAFT_608094 [Hyaloscypha bicolor E]PMD65509.1 hypothetical protein K444DRAFT_608094 [Hyaloscypha bicolor E]
MIDDKFIGMTLAILASCAIGSSYVITKTGLTQAAEHLALMAMVTNTCEVPFGGVECLHVSKHTGW